jgi:hypothetical protein
MIIYLEVAVSIDLLSALKALQLHGMAMAWGELQAEKPKQASRPESWMQRLVDAEMAERQRRSLSYQLQAARFPMHRDLLGFDFSESPLPQAQIEQLQRAQSLMVRLNPDVLPNDPYPPALAVEVLSELPAAIPDPSLQTQALLSTYAPSLQRASALLERARRS